MTAGIIPEPLTLPVPGPAAAAAAAVAAAGMTAGIIPVVLDRGGLRDIVDHGFNGFLGASPQVGLGFRV